MSDRHCDEDLKRAVCTMACYIKDHYFLFFNTRSDIKSQNRYILDIHHHICFESSIYQV